MWLYQQDEMMSHGGFFKSAFQVPTDESQARSTIFLEQI